MGGAYSAVAAGGEPPATLYHPREQPTPMTYGAKFRQAPFRHFWRNDAKVRSMCYAFCIAAPLFYVINRKMGVQFELGWWQELTDGWNTVRRDHQYIDQKYEDYRYFVWRDGKDKAGHMPHGYVE